MSINTDFYEYPKPAGYIQAADGTTLAYFEYGTENEGVPIFILNGFSCCQPNLKHLIDGLTTKYRVITYDYKGHGLSQNPQDMQHINFEGFIDDAQRVLQATKTERAIFIGYSMGAQLMLEYGFQNPSVPVAMISLMGTMGRVFDNFLNTDILARGIPYLYWGLENFSDAYQTVWNLIMKTPFELRFRASSRIFIDGPNCDPEDIRPFLDQLAHLDVRLLVQMAYEMHNHSTLNYLSRIETPALFLAGEHDLFAPLRCSEEATELMPNAELVVIPGGSHNANLERHEFITEETHKFLDKTLSNKTVAGSA